MITDINTLYNKLSKYHDGFRLYYFPLDKNKYLIIPQGHGALIRISVELYNLLYDKVVYELIKQEPNHYVSRIFKLEELVVFTRIKKWFKV